MSIHINTRLGPKAGDPIMSYARGLRAAVAKAMATAGRRSLPVLIGGTIKEKAYATGKLAQSWSIESNSTGLSLTIKNSQPYAKFVESGVSANSRLIGTYPAVVKRFVDWMIARKIQPVTVPGRRQVTPERAARDIIWALNKRKGWRLPPRKIAATAMPRIKEIFTKLIVEARNKHLADCAKGAK